MTKTVIRLLDADGNMLGWCIHYAAIKGDGTLRASDNITITATDQGIVDEVSIHWVDINVETRVPSRFMVTQGQTVQIFPYNTVLIECGHQAGGLPPVTVGSTEVPVPVGQLGARG